MSNLRVAEGTLATISGPLLRFLRLRVPTTQINQIIHVRLVCHFRDIYPVVWQEVRFHSAAQMILEENWAQLGLTSLSKNMNVSDIIHCLTHVGSLHSYPILAELEEGHRPIF